MLSGRVRCRVSFQFASVGRQLAAVRSSHSSSTSDSNPLLRTRFITNSTIAEQCFISPRKHFSRFTASSIMTGTDTFRISDYDVIGFDLDNTLIRYKVTAMVTLEFELLAKYLVDKKGYSPEHLLKPLANNVDFLQKGLILDLKRGNVLKISPNGYIRIASHGSRVMDDAEIVSVYGESRIWEQLAEYTNDLLSTWNGPASEAMRSLLDYFDMPASVLFARCVDMLEETGAAASKTHCVWPDILDGILALYNRDLFQTNSSPYFEELKKNPDKYIHVTNEKLIKMLKELKQKKKTFLLTGSHVDFANLTAGYALGANWRDLFDFVICFGRKPGFFFEQRPFYKLNGATELDVIDDADIQLGTVYTQGNISALLSTLQNQNQDSTGASKVLYVGDNLLQDVYTPFVKNNIDTIAISEELLAEGYQNDNGDQLLHDDAILLTSKRWGSYFGSSSDPTLWTDVIRRNAKLCVADAAHLAQNQLDFEYKCFTEKAFCNNGFYPGGPKHF